jgi:ATPase subunit of ABC transporter with duplicated ATPase domains
MIVATDIELRAGARLLLEGASFQVAAGDRIGLVVISHDVALLDRKSVA